MNSFSNTNAFYSKTIISKYGNYCYQMDLESLLVVPVVENWIDENPQCVIDINDMPYNDTTNTNVEIDENKHYNIEPVFQDEVNIDKIDWNAISNVINKNILISEENFDYNKIEWDSIINVVFNNNAFEENADSKKINWCDIV